MQGDRFAMSQRERDVLKVMSLVLSGRRTQREAARLLDRSVRQVRRVERRLECHGDAGVVHRLRGRPSNRRIDPSQRGRVIKVYGRDYGDFGPTLASEKLSEQGLGVTRETLRRWLIQEGLYKPRRQRDKHRSWRERRKCFGELAQADGSPHDWLEGRGPWLTLLVLIDDATSKVVARFYEAEATEGYMDLLGRYCRKHGRMVSLYTDRHSIFWEEDSQGQLVRTQFTRALAELGIQWIPAYSPQAKGRVERFNGTAQDRLVKELRLAGACTLEAANAVLEKTFLPWFNRRCTVKPASPNEAHRPLHPALNLAAILSVQEERTVANDYTIRYRNEAYQLLPPSRPGLRAGKVIVESRLDGTRHIRFQGKYLPFKPIASAQRVLGALPPEARSLSPFGKPAGQKGQGRTVVAARPCAVYPAFGRSGRTPAEPYLPEGGPKDTEEGRRCPAVDHPWRKFTLACPQRGHF
jgi:transposase